MINFARRSECLKCKTPCPEGVKGSYFSSARFPSHRTNWSFSWSILCLWHFVGCFVKDITKAMSYLFIIELQRPINVLSVKQIALNLNAPSDPLI
jgi:hypothetical protein